MNIASLLYITHIILSCIWHEYIWALHWWPPANSFILVTVKMAASWQCIRPIMLLFEDRIPLPSEFYHAYHSKWKDKTMGAKKLVHFSICACHPCAGAMLIFSVSFQFYRVISVENPLKKIDITIPIKNKKNIYLLLCYDYMSYSPTLWNLWPNLLRSEFRHLFQSKNSRKTCPCEDKKMLQQENFQKNDGISTS